MNKQGRKRLAEAALLIEQAKDIIVEVREEEEGKLENMPESFRYGEKGEQMETYIEYLNEAEENADDAICNLNEI